MIDANSAIQTARRSRKLCHPEKSMKSSSNSDSLKSSIHPVLRLGILWSILPLCLHGQSIEVHDQLQLFTDDYLIDRLSGDARKVLQKPEPTEVVFTADAPWEGNSSAYFSVFQHGDTYRMTYRGSQATDETEVEKEGQIPKPEVKREVTCVAESRDGIHWARPALNRFSWEGSQNNNIVWMGTSAAHNFTAFKDENPAAIAEARYKAIGGKGGPRGFQSADGLHWSMIADKSLVSRGTFDSQNLAFWDAARNEYRMYWRINPKSVRGIRTATSGDFSKWENEADLTYPGKADPDGLDYADKVQLYTNAILPYFRAPQLLIGFPTQFIQKGKQNPPKFYQTQPLFMSSRDGVEFERWDEPIIPTTAPKDRDGNRGNYMAWGLLQLPGKPDEMSVYATEAGNDRGPTRIRRFAYRLDGFVSVRAGAEGGELLTKTLLSSGTELTLNYRAAPGGSVRVELQDGEGKPIQGFRLVDCQPLTGDSVNTVVKWKGNPTLKTRPSGIKARFVLQDADLFSMKW